MGSRGGEEEVPVNKERPGYFHSYLSVIGVGCEGQEKILTELLGFPSTGKGERGRDLILSR